MGKRGPRIEHPSYWADLREALLAGDDDRVVEIGTQVPRGRIPGFWSEVRKFDREQACVNSRNPEETP